MSDNQELRNLYTKRNNLEVFKKSLLQQVTDIDIEMKAISELCKKLEQEDKENGSQGFS